MEKDRVYHTQVGRLTLKSSSMVKGWRETHWGDLVHTTCHNVYVCLKVSPQLQFLRREQDRHGVGRREKDWCLRVEYYDQTAMMGGGKPDGG